MRFTKGKTIRAGIYELIDSPTKFGNPPEEVTCQLNFKLNFKLNEKKYSASCTVIEIWYETGNYPRWHISCQSGVSWLIYSFESETQNSSDFCKPYRSEATISIETDQTVDNKAFIEWFGENFRFVGFIQNTVNTSPMYERENGTWRRRTAYKMDDGYWLKISTSE